MRRLLIVTRPTLAAGFELAGVEAFGAEDVESAQEVINVWLESHEEGLLAVDDGLFENMDPKFIERLNDAKHLHYIVIPGGRSYGFGVSRQKRITEMIRRVIGFHVMFEMEDDEANP